MMASAPDGRRPMESTAAGEPFVTAASLVTGKRFKYGFLVLLPDRLVHVPSGAIPTGGIIGVAVGKHWAVKRALEPSPKATVIALRRIATAKPITLGMARNVLQLGTKDGQEFIFAVKFRKWQAPLTAALSGTSAVVDT
jgi:hypothetical protein